MKYLKTNEELLFNSPGDKTIKDILQNKSQIQSAQPTGYGYSFRCKGQPYHVSIMDILFPMYFFYVGDKEVEASHLLKRKLYNYIESIATKKANK